MLGAVEGAFVFRWRKISNDTSCVWISNERFEDILIFHLDCYLFLISQYRLCQPKKNQKRELNGSVSLNLNFFVDVFRSQIPVDIYYCACRELNIAENSTQITNQCKNSKWDVKFKNKFSRFSQSYVFNLLSCDLKQLWNGSFNA